MNGHGTRASYVRGCKCADCRAANARYAKVAKYRANRGISTLIDAAPVKAHLDQLRAHGIGKRTIAARSGVAMTVINRLIGIDHSRPARRIHPDTARKLLAVTVDDHAGGAFIDATGTRRRLQALVALGWTQTELGRRIGWTTANLNALILRSDTVTRATADLVTELYEQLSMRLGPSTRARSVATRRGWAPPLAWDNIDNPNEQPTERRDPRRGIDALDILELYEAGERVDAIAQRFGLSEGSISTYLRRARQQVAS